MPPPTRFAMTYDFECQGAAWDRELPFRVGIIADLLGDASLPLLVARRFEPLGRDGVAGAMARLQPRRRVAGAVTLAFRSLEDFTPAGVARGLAAAGVAPDAARVREICGEARFRRLEQAWRGLALIAEAAGDDPAVQICILPACRAGFDTALRTPGWLHGRIHDDVFRQAAPAPFALLVGDQAWSAASEDIERLGLIAEAVAPAFVPFVGMAEESLRDLALRYGPGETPGTALAAWHALRGSEASRFLVLTTPSEADAPPFLLAARLVEAFRRDGVCADIPGADPARSQPEAPLVRCGLLPVVTRAHGAAPVMTGSMTLHRPRRYESTQASENALVAATLPYVMVTGRIAQTLMAMARHRVGGFAEVPDLQAWLGRWLAGLVGAGRPGGDGPRPPLYQGRLEVRAVPGEHQLFDAVCWLRPWLGMAVLTSELRMIVRLPRAA